MIERFRHCHAVHLLLSSLENFQPAMQNNEHLVQCHVRLSARRRFSCWTGFPAIVKEVELRQNDCETVFSSMSQLTLPSDVHTLEIFLMFSLTLRSKLKTIFEAFVFSEERAIINTSNFA